MFKISSALVLILGLILYGCGRDSSPTTYLGESADFGGGTIHTYYVAEADGSPVAVGIEISQSAFAGLPREKNDHSRCWDLNGDGTIEKMTECEGDEERFLDMPAESLAAQLPFKVAGINWNPMGHVPPNWQVPHFDFHFYIAEEAAIRGIRVGPCGIFVDCEDYQRGVKPVPARYVPADYINIDAVVSRMGNHLIDSTSKQVSEPLAKATHTLIYGAYDAEIIFIEPMVTEEYLLGSPDACFEVRRPDSYAIAGYYPGEYCIRHDAAADVVRISLEEFAYREAE